MSASLVGSEMCIRDRYSAAGGEGAEGPAALAPNGCAKVPAQSPLLGTVSYTHLTLPTICSV
eukprot:8718786-Alexandrium_andersonii.AAC.1